MWRTLYINWWPHFKKRPVVANPIKCKQTIHGGLLVILQWTLRGWVINIDFIITSVRFNNKGYIFWYCILSYDDNLIFDMNVSYISDQLWLGFFGSTFCQIMEQLRPKPGDPLEIYFLFLSVLLIVCLPDFSSYIKSLFFTVVGFQTWTCWWFSWTDIALVGLYILKMSLTWKHRSMIYFNFGVRFKYVVQHWVC